MLDPLKINISRTTKRGKFGSTGIRMNPIANEVMLITPKA